VVRGWGRSIPDSRFRISDSFFQTSCQDYFSGKKVRRNSRDNLTCAKRDFCAPPTRQSAPLLSSLRVISKKGQLKGFKNHGLKKMPESIG
jgi:hypothetical protein